MFPDEEVVQTIISEERFSAHLQAKIQQFIGRKKSIHFRRSIYSSAF
jgi:hypothetical protein